MARIPYRIRPRATVAYAPASPKVAVEFDPPDPVLVSLAREINKKTRAGKILFFSKNGAVSAIFQNGSKRGVVDLGGLPSEDDVDAIVQALESWSGFQADVPQYSTEIPPLPESGW